MHVEPDRLKVLKQLVDQFGLESLRGILQACESLAQERILDVAVLGQFKSGKSSLLNTVLGVDLFPVGVLPLTAVITRVSAGPRPVARIVHLDETVEVTDADKIAGFITESQNPGNYKNVARVDIAMPLAADLAGLRFVDTPGLGSVLTHNTEATEAWLPNASVALVVVSSERPFSAADRQLLIAARKTASCVAVILNKVDLLSETERAEVCQFIQRALRQEFDVEIPVIPFSSRRDSERWARQLRESVIQPITSSAAHECDRALRLKLETACAACHGYLRVALEAAVRDDAGREQLRQAIHAEIAGEALIRDELDLARQHVHKKTRPAFEESFFAHASACEDRLQQNLGQQLAAWRGNLAVQSKQYRQWAEHSLRSELTPMSADAFTLAGDLLQDAETRFKRLLEAFRDRLSQAIQHETGIAVSPVAWLPSRAQLHEIPISISHPFMTNWELLWWLLPMAVVGGLFRQHLMNRIPRETEKNLSRLVSEWTVAVDEVVANLEVQALAWTNAELATLKELIQQSPATAPRIREAIERLAAPA